MLQGGLVKPLSFAAWDCKPGSGGALQSPGQAEGLHLVRWVKMRYAGLGEEDCGLHLPPSVLSPAQILLS